MFINLKSNNCDKNQIQFTGSFVFFLFNNNEEFFHKIFYKLLKMILLGEVTSLNEISNSLFVLIIIFSTYYVNLYNEIATSIFPDETKQIK
jgi:hypothetical protein